MSRFLGEVTSGDLRDDLEDEDDFLRSAEVVLI